MSATDFMRLAYAQAQLAEEVDEVPVGAVVVFDNKVIASGFNRPIQDHDPTAHAEIVAMRQAARQLQNYRLVGCDIYVTLEPCAMCAMAMVHARINMLYFAALDSKAGAVGSVINILEEQAFNHRVQYKSGLLAQPCSQLLKDFFKKRR